MDPTQFRERFKAWKEGKKPYQDGLPAYSGGKKSKYTKDQEKVIDQAYTYFKNLGYDDISIAGILGNALTESSLNPDSVSNSKTYHGIFQNNKNIRDAIVNQYGDYSLASQLKYAHDWNSKSDWVTGGKYAEHTATNAGKFKKKGYQSAVDAANAWMRLYERPVILDAKGNVVGYQSAKERAHNAAEMYSHIQNKYNNQNPVITTTRTGDGNKVMKFDYGQQFQPQPVPKPIPETQYPLSGSQAPESLSSWNAAQSPSATPTIPSIQKLNNERNAAVQGAFQLPGVTVLGNRRTSLLPKLPSLNDALMAYSPQNQMNRAVSDMLGLNDLWEDLDVTSDLFKAKDGKQPKGLPYPLRSSRNYNDNLAYQKGIVRDPKTGHMWSTTQEKYPQERTYLKYPNHPTHSLAVWGDMSGGYDVYYRNGVEYSSPNFASRMYLKPPS